MKITRMKIKKHSHYFIDGKFVSHDALNEICGKYLSNEGLMEMWRRVTDTGECTLELDFNFDEKSLLEEKNTELQQERAKNAALEKKLLQLRIKAAKYDCLMSAV